MANNRVSGRGGDDQFNKSMDANERFVPRTDDNGRVDARPAIEVTAADLNND